MNYFDGLFLGALQGVTEFLPISSSGHLVLAESFLGLKVEDLKSFDVFVHLATFLVILIYFWSDVKKLILLEKNYRKLVAYIIIGTLPAVMVGFLWGDLLDEVFRKASSVAALMVMVGGIFILAEIFYKKLAAKKNLDEMNWKQALVIGLAQALALVPGISRSGATIVGGIVQGIKREDAAKFSFLLGLPAMLGAFTLTAAKMSAADFQNMALGPSFVGFVAAVLFGLMSVSFLMKFLKTHSLNAFAVYRILLGAGILLSFYNFM
ncbi:MAG: undecaprenyl-diphosphatase UppP [Candidatus Gracilibacteria bacterium]